MEADAVLQVDDLVGDFLRAPFGEDAVPFVMEGVAAPVVDIAGVGIGVRAQGGGDFGSVSLLVPCGFVRREAGDFDADGKRGGGHARVSLGRFAAADVIGGRAAIRQPGLRPRCRTSARPWRCLCGSGRNSSRRAHGRCGRSCRYFP